MQEDTRCPNCGSDDIYFEVDNEDPEETIILSCDACGIEIELKPEE